MNWMVGQTFLREEFAYKLKIAWHADEFGHSAVTPDLLREMGMQAIFVGRIDDDERAYRKEN